MSRISFKERLVCLIERIKLSDFDYKTMKWKSQKYDGMMSAIKFSVGVEYAEVEDSRGIILMLNKSRKATVDINIVELLEKGGFTFNKNITELNITGLNEVS